jgi:hypothetical protein
MGNIRSGAERLEAFLGASTRRALVLAITIGLIVLGARITAENWISKHVLARMWSGYQMLAALPMGAGGLVLLGALSLCVVFAFIDTSPSVAALREWRASRKRIVVHSGTLAPVIGAEERDEIQKVRYFWRKYGVFASGSCWKLLNAVVGDLRATNSLANYVQPLLIDLSEAQKRMDTAVANDTALTRVGVVEALNEHTASYRKAYGLLVDIDIKHMRIRGDKFEQRYGEWFEAHTEYLGELDQLNERPANYEQLVTWKGFGQHPFLRPPDAPSD